MYFGIRSSKASISKFENEEEAMIKYYTYFSIWLHFIFLSTVVGVNMTF